MRRLNVGAAPVQIIQRAPGVAVAVLGFLFLDVVLLQDVAPAQAGIGELRFVAIARPHGAGNDDGFEFLRAEHGAAAVGGEMIVVVGEHGGAIHILAGGTDAQHSGVAVADDLAQTIFGVAGAERPRLARRRAIPPCRL